MPHHAPRAHVPGLQLSSSPNEHEHEHEDEDEDALTPNSATSKPAACSGAKPEAYLGFPWLWPPPSKNSPSH